jgi:hypothetical protein
MRGTHLIVVIMFLAGLAIMPGWLVAQTDSSANPGTNGLGGAQSPQLDEQAGRFGVLPSQTAQLKQATKTV